MDRDRCKRIHVARIGMPDRDLCQNQRWLNHGRTISVGFRFAELDD